MFLEGLPQYGNTRWEVFTPQQDSTTSRGWMSWLKPVGAQWIYIFACGGGGGGAGGQSTAGAARAGGGGGSEGGYARLFLPAFVFPDVIYVRPGMGGAGGAAAGNGTAGTHTYLSLNQDISNFPLVSAFGGNAGAATGAGGGVPASPSISLVAAFGFNAVTAGAAGAAGGANTGAVGSSVSTGGHHVVTPGAGGGSSGTGNNVFVGGSQTLNAPVMGPMLWGLVAGGAAGVSGSQAGGDGRPGYNHGLPLVHVMSRNQPLQFGGGSGGGSGGASLGGRGGDAAWGAGGGGGGAGSTGGVGGKGGDGFVIIGAF